jgi:hypothetical protein
MSLRSAHCEIRALTARRASHQLWSYAGLIVERYSSLSASVTRSTASLLVGAILNALHYSADKHGIPAEGLWRNGAPGLDLSFRSLRDLRLPGPQHLFCCVHISHPSRPRTSRIGRNVTRGLNWCTSWRDYIPSHKAIAEIGLAWGRQSSGGFFGKSAQLLFELGHLRCFRVEDRP